MVISMKEINYNYDNLKLEDVDEVIVRTKALLINSSNEILLGYSHRTYQFPGGHLEEGESLIQCLVREVLEETGISLDINDALVPFLKTVYYTRNYHGTGKNRENDIYFYVIKTDENFDLAKMDLDDWEKDGNFMIKKIPLSNIEEILMESILDNPINEVIVEEMLEAIKEVKKIYNLKSK